MSAIFEFRVYDEPPFRFALDDQRQIDEVVAILIRGLAKGVMGTVVKETAEYNPGWSYHLEPSSIEFFESAVEVCDSTPLYVEEHLDEVGGSLLPDSRWCPWASVLTGEIVRGSSDESIEAAIDDALASSVIHTHHITGEVLELGVDAGGVTGRREYRVELRVMRTPT